eukprot:Skav226600  [mRNA]  locus=scaffold5607:67787:70360:+ [translate_table: standard]
MRRCCSGWGSDQLGKHVTEERIGQGRVLLALLDLCLGPPSAPDAPLLWFLKSESSSVPMATWPAGEQMCSDAEFADRLRQQAGTDLCGAMATCTTCYGRVMAQRVQDAAGVGLPNAAGRDLLRRLLHWDPNERLQAQAPKAAELLG